ncbi:hypothetical protein G6F56_002982 [Rhizopus delemar]|nr:hypothetical protein G6F56_002982 [Rhizopus delemar]
MCTRTSIDAQADKIDVIIDLEKFNVQVNDNGTGIQNLSRIGQRYATSKCHSLQDLHQIKTFGFRGEALCSIISISMVQIISRHYLSSDTFEAFWRDNKTILSKGNVRKAHSGTSVIVRDLFYKTSPYQYVVMLETVKRSLITFALCFPFIHFTLKEGSRNILAMKKCSTSLEAFRQLAAHEMKYLEPLEAHEDNVKLDGFFSTQSYPNKEHQYIYINHHHIPTTSELYKTVSDEFGWIKAEIKGRRIARYPIFFVRLESDDWSSYEIDSLYFNHDRIKLLLQQFTQLFLRRVGLEVPKKTLKRPRVDDDVNSLFVKHSVGSSLDHSQIHSVDTSSLKRHMNYTQPVRYQRQPLVFSGSQRLSKQDLKMAHVLGQVDKKFIALRLDQTLLFVDQHAADERIKLEVMMKSEVISRQTAVLDPCIPLELSPLDYDVVTKECVLEQLKTWGIYLVKRDQRPLISEGEKVIMTGSRYFSPRPQGGTYVTRLPDLIADKCLAQPELVRDIIRDHAYWMMEQHYNPAIVSKTCPKGVIELLKSKACRSAIMFNEELSLEQCQSMVRNLSKTSFPFQCAHGRPSVVPIHIQSKQPKRTRKIHWETLL